MESQLIEMAAWIRKNYGSTMNQALKTVLPIKKQTRHVEHKTVKLLLDETQAQQKLALFESKHYKAKARLLRELIAQKEIDYTMITQKLNVSAATIRNLQEQQILQIETTTCYWNPVQHLTQEGYHLTLNENQKQVVDQITEDLSLIHI